jgi:hypothetical protein
MRDSQNTARELRRYRCCPNPLTCRGPPEEFLEGILFSRKIDCQNHLYHSRVRFRLSGWIGSGL